MAWTDLKASIAQVIRTNGNQEITGALLQLTLNSIVDQLGADATLKGVATPATNPNTTDGIAFYIASELGTYANFGGLKVNSGEIAVFYSNGTEWTKMSLDLTQTIAESISDSATTLMQEIAAAEGRSGTALSTARGAITQEIAESEGRSSTALSTARDAITQEIAESEGRSGTALSTAINSLSLETTCAQDIATIDGSKGIIVYRIPNLATTKALSIAPVTIEEGKARAVEVIIDNSLNTTNVNVTLPSSVTGYTLQDDTQTLECLAGERLVLSLQIIVLSAGLKIIKID